MERNRSRRGGVDMKLVLALVFALGGVSWGVVSFMSSRNDTKEDRPRLIATALDNEGNAVDPDYSRASTARQIDAIRTGIEEAISAQAQTVLSSIEVPKGVPGAVSTAAINAFLPILTGDHASFLNAIVAMGGVVPGELEEDHPLFTHLSGTFKNAKVDLSRITVERFVAPEGRRELRREVTDDEDVRAGDGGKTSVSTRVMEMRPDSIFPDAPPKSDPTAILIKIPVQPKGEKEESVFGLVLTWNTNSKHWQPAAYQMIQNRIEEED